MNTKILCDLINIFIMGVKDLWELISSVKREISLKDLKNKVIAIDLSIWIVEASNYLPKHIPKPHLRHIFFRTSLLLQYNVLPIIVLEGEPPIVKMKTIQNRLGNNNEFRHTKRSRFKALHKESKELLESLGVPCIQAPGEAEALCAHLNRIGVVDGIITNDGDAFLYGARVVYSHFSINLKTTKMMEYRMVDIEDKLSLKRESLVGYAILAGCDYVPQGVHGCGRVLVYKLISSLHNQTLLDRFEYWIENKEDLEAKLVRKNETVDTKDLLEFSVAKKALSCPGFPFPEVSQEYLRRIDKVLNGRMVWKRPQILTFVDLTVKKLQWIEAYAFNKVLPLLTHHMICFPADLTPPITKPLRIFKKRIRNGEESFQVEWQKIDGDVYTSLDCYTTIEKQSPFASAYPLIVSDFDLQNQTKKGFKNKLKKSKEKLSKKEFDLVIDNNNENDESFAIEDFIEKFDRILLDDNKHSQVSNYKECDDGSTSVNVNRVNRDSNEKECKKIFIKDESFHIPLRERLKLKGVHHVLEDDKSNDKNALLTFLKDSLNLVGHKQINEEAEVSNKVIKISQNELNNSALNNFIHNAENFEDCLENKNLDNVIDPAVENSLLSNQNEIDDSKQHSAFYFDSSCISIDKKYDMEYQPLRLETDVSPTEHKSLRSSEDKKNTLILNTCHLKPAIHVEDFFEDKESSINRDLKQILSGNDSYVKPASNSPLETSKGFSIDSFMQSTPIRLPLRERLKLKMKKQTFINNLE